MTEVSELPDDVRDEIQAAAAPPPNMATLEAISIAIAKRRDDAKAARSSSGIELTWKECEEAYVGIDDANRAEFTDARWSKPMSMDGPVTTGRKSLQTDYKSTAYVRLTARYVDAGAAKLGEILLPVDDKSFSFSETPVPELVKAKDDNSQVVHDGMGGVPLMRAPKPGEPVPAAVPPAAAPAMGPSAAPPTVPGATQPLSPAATPVPAAAPVVPPAGAAGGAGQAPPPAPPQVPLTVKDLAQENIDLARKKAKLAEKRIYDWMVESQYQAEMRKVIFDSARIGVGVLKGPFPKSYRGIAMEKADDGGVDLQIKDSVKPAYKWVDPWNIFPDQACGENIHLGDFVLERDHLSERQVRDLKKIPGYIAAQIDKVLEQGPDNASDDRSKNSPNAALTKGRYEIWYYYGTIEADEMDCICAAATGDPAKASDGKPKKQVYAIVTLINSCVIRATVNPLDSGSFPYHSVPWQRRAGHWAGIGVAEQARMPQKTINAATRAMLNNAGKSAGCQVIIDQSSVRPADNQWVLTPDKIWYKTGDSPGSDVRAAMQMFEIPNQTDHLMTIINYALKLAEESTSIPLITQGQSGPTTPDTFGAAQLQNNNANQLLRSIGYAFDDYITEPVVRQSYEWLLLDPEVSDDEKGDFTINAHGSIALVERAIQDQTIASMANMVKDPAFGFDPRKWAKMFLKSKRIDPADVQYSEEEQEKIDSQPPTPLPAVQVAQINASVQRDALVMKQGVEERTSQNESAIAAAAQELEGGRVQAEQQRTLTEATVKLHELQTRHEIAMLDHATKRGISLDSVKADLAKTAMTLQTQKELNAADGLIDLHKHHTQPKPQIGAKPPGQTPGRAGNGRGFEQGPAA